MICQTDSSQWVRCIWADPGMECAKDDAEMQDKRKRRTTTKHPEIMICTATRPNTSKVRQARKERYDDTIVDRYFQDLIQGRISKAHTVKICLLKDNWSKSSTTLCIRVYLLIKLASCQMTATVI